MKSAERAADDLGEKNVHVKMVCEKHAKSLHVLQLATLEKKEKAMEGKTALGPVLRLEIKCSSIWQLGASPTGGCRRP